MAAIAQSKPLRASRRERWAWYMYDFGNSAYAAVVLLAVYATYFKDEVVGGAEGTQLWGIALAIAMAVVAITSPVLGVIADFSGTKKRFLFVFTGIVCLFTGLLFFVTSGDIVLGMVLFIIAEIGYRSAQVYYNSLLPEIAEPHEIGRVSGNGWAIGSAGGIICLLIVLALILTIGGGIIVRFAMVFTALYFAVSTIPTFAWLKERAQPQALPHGETYLSIAGKRLRRTFRAVRHHRNFIKFMVAFLIYNDGILMALEFAAILGLVLYGIEGQELIIFMIIVQVASVAGAFIAGWAADRYNAKTTLVVSLILMILSVVWIMFNFSKLGFFLIGALAGFALTGVQSVSRTVVGMFSPEGQSGEFYGFFAVAGRTSSVLGPAIFGVVATQLTFFFQRRGRDAVLAEQTGHRMAILTVVLFLVVGLVLLLQVDEMQGRAAARPTGGESAA